MTYTAKPQDGKGNCETYMGVSDVIVSMQDGICYLVLLFKSKKKLPVYIPADDFFLEDETGCRIFATGHEKGTV